MFLDSRTSLARQNKKKLKKPLYKHFDFYSPDKFRLYSPDKCQMQLEIT